MDSEPRDPLVGTPVLGGYVITGLLGTGGMGSVYVAEHQRINKKVAIKVLHPHMIANRDIVERFLAEARAASALDHPNIIEVIDAATLDDGRDYIALEFLAGEALDDYIRDRGRLDPAPALRILAQACCGLEAAHHRGIIHRDLKPANLFIAPTELDPLRVKVLDFGIAKLNDTLLAGGIETGTNAVAGTPGYMAPEQARGMRDVDHRADIYALGAVAYRMMSGALPYEGESLGEIIYQQLSSPPVSVAQRRPDLDPGWTATIMACLGAEPGMRPPSARDMTLRLAAATPGGLDIVRSAAPLLFSDAWIERNRALVSALPQPPVLSHPAPGGTATYETQNERPAAAPAPTPAVPATTLSSAAGMVASNPSVAPRVAGSRRWLLVAALVAGTAIVGAVGTALVVGRGSNKAASAPPPDAAPIAADAAPSVVANEPPDAAPPETEPPTPKPRTVKIAFDLKPRDATAEIDGAPIRERTLALEIGSEHTLVVRRRGYHSETKTFRAAADQTIEIALRRRKRTNDHGHKPHIDGPISTDLDSEHKPIGPITNEL